MIVPSDKAGFPSVCVLTDGEVGGYFLDFGFGFFFLRQTLSFLENAQSLGL
jgi:hypothetical protein